MSPRATQPWPWGASAGVLPAAPRRPRGFTLIELAMTTFLLSVGLLAVFALLRRGLESRRELEAEAQGTAFADAAFGTLRFAADHAARATPTNGWAAFWTAFADGRTNLPLVGDATWQQEDAEETEDDRFLFGDGTLRTNRVFLLESSRAADALPDARILYRCSVLVTNTFDSWLTNYPTNRVEVTLHVWPGQTPNAPAQTFFTLFSNPGRLP